MPKRAEREEQERIDHRRRRALGAGLGSVALVAALPVNALPSTPRQPRGPFYPEQLPLDRDNDLTVVEGAAAPARGEPVEVIGQVLDRDGRPLTGARVEIWQCDANGRYRHRWDRGERPLDPGFQGYGSTLSDAEGRYRFRTIRPVAYPGRAPHIHFAIQADGRRELVTQMYVSGAPENRWDGLLGSLGRSQREALLVDFDAQARSAAGDAVGRFDVVLG